MVIRTKKGFFEVLKNVKDAFNIENFEQCYIEEWYDQFTYIVGDISDNRLRLKGFSTNPSSRDYFQYIPEYLIESCNYKPAYFILKRCNEEFYNKNSHDHQTEEITQGDTEVLHIEKENFNYETLVLEHTQKNNPHIVIDLASQNQVSTFELPQDLKNEIQREKLQEQNQRRHNNRRNNNNNNNNFNNRQRRTKK